MSDSLQTPGCRRHLVMTLAVNSAASVGPNGYGQRLQRVVGGADLNGGIGGAAIGDGERGALGQRSAGGQAAQIERAAGAGGAGIDAAEMRPPEISMPV